LRAKHSEIRGRISANNDRGNGAPIYERNACLLNALYDVLIG